METPEAGTGVCLRLWAEKRTPLNEGPPKKPEPVGLPGGHEEVGDVHDVGIRLNRPVPCQPRSGALEGRECTEMQGMGASGAGGFSSAPAPPSVVVVPSDGFGSAACTAIAPLRVV